MEDLSMKTKDRDVIIKNFPLNFQWALYQYMSVWLHEYKLLKTILVSTLESYGMRHHVVWQMITNILEDPEDPTGPALYLEDGGRGCQKYSYAFMKFVWYYIPKESNITLSMWKPYILCTGIHKKHVVCAQAHLNVSKFGISCLIF